MKKQHHIFKVQKAMIPFQGFMDKADNWHVYDVNTDSTSTLLGVFKHKKHATHFKNYLEMRKQ